MAVDVNDDDSCDCSDTPVCASALLAAHIGIKATTERASARAADSTDVGREVGGTTARESELLRLLRVHPHIGAILGQFEVDSIDPLGSEEEYEGESEERAQAWKLLYELLAGKPMPPPLGYLRLVEDDEDEG